MAANLTPQYRKAEEEYRRAGSVEEEVRCLQRMLQEIPKHKSSEKLQAEIKQKISKAKKELASERKSGKRGFGIRIPRQGAGTAIVIGGPNSGKSTLVTRLTRATPEVAAYPFTTRMPTPGMMPWEDAMVQLIDTPPITRDHFEAYMHGLIRSADVALLMVDLASDDGIEACQDVVDTLAPTKTRLARTSYLDERDIGLSFTRTLLVPNKIDAPDAEARLELLHELCPLEFEEFVISAEHGAGLEALRDAVYRSLDVIRVYTKLPSAKEPDMNRPFTLHRGGTVRDVAEQVHNEFADKLRFARVWGADVHDGTVVKGDFALSDRDVVELHI